MLASTDDQLEIVMVAAGSLPVEKRSVFLERVGYSCADLALPTPISTPRYKPHCWD
jgi:hypothetical protein